MIKVTVIFVCIKFIVEHFRAQFLRRHFVCFKFIANGRVVIDFKVNGQRPGFIPDGMTIDTDGNLYVALWAGSKVLKINPT